MPFYLLYITNKMDASLIIVGMSVGSKDFERRLDYCVFIKYLLKTLLSMCLHMQAVFMPQMLCAVLIIVLMSPL